MTKTHRLWLQPLANSQAHLGAGVIFQGHIYLVNTAGIAECFELKSGKTIWTERLTGTGGSGASWSSPVLAGRPSLCAEPQRGRVRPESRTRDSNSSPSTQSVANP